jgi:hypothetical protein
MKHIILTILLLFGFYSFAFGAFGVDGVSSPASVDGVSNPASVDGVTASTGFCSSATAPPSLICEDSEGSTTVETGTTDWTTAWQAWTPDIHSSDTLYEQAHTNSWGCTNIGSNAIRFDVDGATDQAEERASVVSTFGADQSTVFAEVCFDLTDTTLPQNGHYAGFLQLQNSTGATKAHLAIHYDNVDYAIRLQYHDSGCGGSYTTPTIDTANNFTTDQPVCVQIQWQNTNLVEVKIDTNQDGSWNATLYNDTSVCADDVRKVLLGTHTYSLLANTEGFVWEADLLGVDTTAPGVCAQ